MKSAPYFQVQLPASGKGRNARCWPAAETNRLRPICQALKPVPPVTGETLRPAIRCILLQKRRKRAKRILTQRQFIDQRGVNIRHPPLEERGTKAIQYDMVATLVPKEVIRCRLEQRKREKRATQKVDWLRQVGLHPCLGNCLGIRLRAEVEQR